MSLPKRATDEQSAVRSFCVWHSLPNHNDVIGEYQFNIEKTPLEWYIKYGNILFYFSIFSCPWNALFNSN